MNDVSYTIDCLPGSAAPTIAGPTPKANRYAEKDTFHFDSVDSAYQSRAHFESAQTDRLNESHWQYAHVEEPVNEALYTQLPTMRARSNHEALNNPTIEGLILSHTLAVAGED